MNNKEKIELIALMINRLNEHLPDLIQNTDLINSSKENENLTELTNSLNYSCQLCELINQPLFENDKKLILL